MVLTISLTKGVSMKRILINSSYNDELRVALVDGAKLFDLDTEVTDRDQLDMDSYHLKSYQEIFTKKIRKVSQSAH